MFTFEAKRKFWTAKPFPHLIIDDFLPSDKFNKLSKELVDHFHIRKSQQKFNTSIEKNKETFSNDQLGAETLGLISEVTKQEFLDKLSFLTSIYHVTPLTSQENYIYKFLHKMTDGGFLGSHVDHSYINKNDGHVHYLNCIYYAHDLWDTNNWGGETLMYDSLGFKVKNKIAPKPNRLLIFLHSAHSWHGTAKLTGNRHIDRFTIYMDYYCRVNEIPALQNNARIYANDNDYFLPEFWQHKTTFSPRLKLDSIKYWGTYLKYLLRKSF